MSGFGVAPSDLQAAEVVLEEAAQEGRAELARLRACAQELLGGGWHGAAGAAFGQGWEGWLDGALLVLAALEEMARALGLTGREYAEFEAAVRVDLGRIAS